MSEATEIIFRLIVSIPLAVAVVFSVLLRRILRSIAWTLITLSFLHFAVFVAVSMIVPLNIYTRLGIQWVGYWFMAAGLWRLHHDLRSLRRARKLIPPEAEEKTNADSDH